MSGVEKGRRQQESQPLIIDIISSTYDTFTIDWKTATMVHIPIQRIIPWLLLRSTIGEWSLKNVRIIKAKPNVEDNVIKTITYTFEHAS
jgi:hypothetical protein